MRLFKRGRIWYTHVYEGAVRVQRSTRCHDRKAAEATARQLELDAADPANATARSALLRDALRLLLEHCAALVRSGSRSPDTLIYYKSKVGHWSRVFEPDGRAFPLSELRASHIDEFIKLRQDEGASHHTIAKELAVMRFALRLAKRRGLWRGDVAELFPPSFSPEYHPRRRTLSRDELSRLLATLTPDHAARCAFIVASSACWRESERARREDVRDRLVHLRGSKRPTRNRLVPIETEEQRSLIAFALKYAQGSKGKLFRPWGNVPRDLAAGCERAGIDRCSPNDLRRTFAKWLRMDGVPLELIAPMMGHSNTRMLELVYGRLSAEELGCRVASAIASEELGRLAAHTATEERGKQAAEAATEDLDKQPAYTATQEPGKQPTGIASDTLGKQAGTTASRVHQIRANSADPLDSPDSVDQQFQALLRARQDSNLRPLDSKSGALSS